jgi:spore coat polysaccharide biosynthesis protein SpsF (cytidylyltransferase family)
MRYYTQKLKQYSKFRHTSDSNFTKPTICKQKIQFQHEPITAYSKNQEKAKGFNVKMKIETYCQQQKF